MAGGKRAGERGALMVALMAAIAVMAILSAVAAQSWADVVRRENEAEMMFRADDIVRALRRYQKDQGKLPNELKALTEAGTRGQYFIRRLWKDPLVKGGKWQLVYAAPGGGLFDPTAAQIGSGETGHQGPAPGQQQLGSPLAGAPAQTPEVTRNDDGTAEVSGLPIAGVKTRSTDPPFRHWRDKDAYHDWVFSIFDNIPLTPSPGQAPSPGQTGAPGTQKAPEATFPPR